MKKQLFFSVFGLALFGLVGCGSDDKKTTHDGGLDAVVAAKQDTGTTVSDANAADVAVVADAPATADRVQFEQEGGADRGDGRGWIRGDGAGGDRAQFDRARETNRPEVKLDSKQDTSSAETSSSETEAGTTPGDGGEDAPVGG